MKDQAGDRCPFDFNFDPATFQVGDLVSYRVPDLFGDFPFVGTLAAVLSDHVLIHANSPEHPGRQLRASRESRPMVEAGQLKADP